MYKEVLRSIDSVGIFPVISFVIFFTFFIFLLVQVWRYDRSLMGKMSSLPIDSVEKKFNGTGIE